jgi:hypothetical protein
MDFARVLALRHRRSTRPRQHHTHHLKNLRQSNVRADRHQPKKLLPKFILSCALPLSFRFPKPHLTIKRYTYLDSHTLPCSSQAQNENRRHNILGRRLQ